MHSRFGAAGGAEAPLIGEEAVADYGDAVYHRLAAISRVGLGHAGDVQGDEGVDPEIDHDVFTCGGRGRGAALLGYAALDVVGSWAAVLDEGSGAAGSGVVKAFACVSAGAGAGFADAAFDVCGIVGAVVLDGES